MVEGPPSWTKWGKRDRDSLDMWRISVDAPVSWCEWSALTDVRRGRSRPKKCWGKMIRQAWCNLILLRRVWRSWIRVTGQLVVEHSIVFLWDRLGGHTFNFFFLSVVLELSSSFCFFQFNFPWCFLYSDYRIILLLLVLFPMFVEEHSPFWINL